MRTQEYTAVICMAERSLTFLPAVEPPKKKLYPLPDVRFWGLSRDLNKPEKMPIGLTSLSFYFWISKYLTERGERCIL
nr:MAG TPA: hypothetical protein [Caudoviricetes sp.]